MTSVLPVVQPGELYGRAEHGLGIGIASESARTLVRVQEYTTIAGTGEGGLSGDGGTPAAMLNSPTGLAFDAVGNLYVADCCNHRIGIIVAVRMIVEGP